MNKSRIIIGILVAAAFFGVVGSAAASMLIPAADKPKEKAKAPENSPVINDDWGLERIDFIHYVKPEGPTRAPKTPTCYKLLGPKWKSLPVNYVINPTNSQSLDEGFVTAAVSASAETWDGATSSEVFNNEYKVSYDVSYGTQDFVNAISFGDYPESRVIAVTTIWWSPRGRQIVEFDVMFDTDWTWGDATVDPTVMDLENIATHELGHGVGLADVYDSACSEVTMYGYSNYGEIQKRTLESPDVTGIQQLYGGL